ncbi:uncharacterized protein LOC121380626 [Gigantopelta aegis]|uniref:uncharacterized protein LOC121380626 n=1 Tax=Gigantopelta aegis TaxID=1735272 RepID=UPI001B88885F|nr:uncharacterized protein LOC121380626 [Gigantopelta aegis]XP_041365464.1 uncharacterized protein LOC121380626 [Gigantopelta aegis]
MADRRQSQTSSSETSVKSANIPAHHKWMPYTGPVVFTGPSGLRDYRASTFDGYQAIGIGARSEESTAEVSYINRTAPGQMFQKPKNRQIGEIGWEYETFKLVKGI